MWKSRLIYALTLAGVLVFHTYYTGWFSWYLLVLMLALPFFSLVCSLPSMLRLRISANFPESCRIGTPVSLRIGSENAQRLTPPYRFDVLTEDKMAGSAMRQRIFLSGSKTAQVELPTQHAGAYRCSLQKGSVCDYLGLFRFPLKLPALGELLVRPEPLLPPEKPSLSELNARSYRAKPAGGFSEIHDLRDYHPGDSMRDIHWKLSAKTDGLIVREPLEAVRAQAILSFDLAGPRETVDRTLGLLLGMSGWLLKEGLTHTVCWLEPSDCSPQSALIAHEADIRKLLDRLLRTTLGVDTPSIAQKSFPAADWRYHIRPDGQEVCV